MRRSPRCRRPADPLKADGLTVAFGGQVFQQTDIGISVIELFGLIFAAVVLIVTFGSLLAAGLPLLSAIVALGVSMGVVITASAFTTLSTATPMLALMIGLAVGIDYAPVHPVAASHPARGRHGAEGVHRDGGGDRRQLRGVRRADRPSSRWPGCSWSGCRSSGSWAWPRRSRWCSRCSRPPRCCRPSWACSADASLLASAGRGRRGREEDPRPALGRPGAQGPRSSRWCSSSACSAPSPCRRPGSSSRCRMAVSRPSGRPPARPTTW